MGLFYLLPTVKSVKGKVMLVTEIIQNSIPVNLWYHNDDVRQGYKKKVCNKLTLR